MAVDIVRFCERRPGEGGFRTFRIGFGLIAIKRAVPRAPLIGQIRWRHRPNGNVSIVSHNNTATPVYLPPGKAHMLRVRRRFTKENGGFLGDSVKNL